MTVLKRLRHSAGLLMAVFAGHLGLVSSGAVCVLPGMASMAGAAASPALPAESNAIPDMQGMSERADVPASSRGGGAVRADEAPAGHGPCPGPSPGQCVAAMPCVTALRSDLVDTSLEALAFRDGDVVALAVLMPASSGTAPELPPPRA